MHFAETILDKLLAAGGRYPAHKVHAKGANHCARSSPRAAAR